MPTIIRCLSLAACGVVLGTVAPITAIVGIGAYIAYLILAMHPWQGMIGAIALFGGALGAAIAGIIS